MGKEGGDKIAEYLRITHPLQGNKWLRLVSARELLQFPKRDTEDEWSGGLCPTRPFLRGLYTLWVWHYLAMIKSEKSAPCLPG